MTPFNNDNVIFDLRERRNKIIQDYERQHHCCPECGSHHLQVTLMGNVVNLDNPDDYIDENNAYCIDCGWNGKVYNLVPRKGDE